MPRALLMTGDAAEELDTMYPYYRVQEGGWQVDVASRTTRPVQLVIHEFDPDSDAYVEKNGRKLPVDLPWSEVRLEDYDAAVSTYESILADLDPKNVEALRAIADLEEKRDNPGAAAAALVRLVAASEGEDKLEFARKLADLYEGPLDDPHGAMRALDVVIAAECAWLAPLPPEGASAILYGSTDHAADMAREQRVGAPELLADGIVHHIVAELPEDDAESLCNAVAAEVGAHLRDLLS